MRVGYRDRYLFSPLSVSLLLELVAGLRQTVGEAHWNVADVEICTTNRRPSGINATGNMVWSDWEENRRRDAVLTASFAYAGMNARLKIGDTTETGHGRTLEVEWASGTKIGIRLDQGVSYWRAAASNPRDASYFSFQRVSNETQAERVADLRLKIEGGQLPTQIFVKVRDTTSG